MKTNIIIISVLLSSIVNLYAQNYEISTNVGYNTTQQNSPLDHGYSYGIRVNKYLNKNSAIGLAYNFMNKVKDKNSSKENNIHRASLNLIHDFQTRNKKLKPYVFVGGGYEYIDEEYNDILSQAFVDYGVGIKYQISDSFNISADMQAIHKLDNSNIDLLSSIGIGMIFGEKERKKPKQDVKTVKIPLPKPKVEKKVAKEEKPHNRRITIIKKVVYEKQPTVSVSCDTKRKPKLSHRGKYYVQLMTVFKTDLESGKLPIFKKLKQGDYHYKIRYPITNGKTSSTLVVGPYQTRDEAKFYLADLKSLKSDAYIIKIR